MKEYVDKLVAAVKREPVRVRLYGVAASVLAVLAFHDVVQLDAVPVYLGLAASALVVERTRAQTVPAVKSSRKRKR